MMRTTKKQPHEYQILYSHDPTHIYPVITKYGINTLYEAYKLD
jgi:hypothetical protein